MVTQNELIEIFCCSITGAIWRTDLDVLVDDEINMVVITSPSNVQAYNQSNGDSQHHTVSSTNFWESVSPEYVNYLVACLLLSVQYASVFWNTKMSFSFVFVFHLLVATVFDSLAFCNASILYKFQVRVLFISCKMVQLV